MTDERRKPTPVSLETRIVNGLTMFAAAALAFAWSDTNNSIDENWDNLQGGKIDPKTWQFNKETNDMNWTQHSAQYDDAKGSYLLAGCDRGDITRKPRKHEPERKKK